MDMVRNSGHKPNVLDRNTIMDEEKTPSPLLAETKRNLVVYIENEFERFLDWHRKDRYREDRNHKFYTALDYSQWPDEIRNAVGSDQDHRDLSQYNFLHKKILGFVGMLSKNPQDTDFISQTPDHIDGALLMKSIMMKDQELCGWESVKRKAIKNGLIYGSFVRMGVTKKFNELGNIEIECLKPGSVLTSPYWDTESMSDCQSAVTVSYMTAREAKKRYKHKAHRIDNAIRLMAEARFRQRDDEHVVTEYDLEELYEQKYRFIEYHHMVEEDVVRMIGVAPDGTYVDVPEPPKNLKNDTSVKEWIDNWFKYNHIDKNSVIKKKSTVSKYYVATACHALDSHELFENDLGTIQAGRLPLIHFAYDRHNGRNITPIDLLADPQVTFNSRMSMISDIIGKASKDGYLYDPEAFGNDPRKMAEFEEKSSQPGFAMATEPGYVADNNKVFAELPSNSYGMQQQASMDANQMFDMMGELTPQNRAMEGLNDSSHETGKLFNEKKDQGEVNMDFLYHNLSMFNKELGDLWYVVAQVIYTEIYRQFTLATGETFEINRTEYTPDGMSYMINDISMIPRQEIAISQSASGLTQRTNDRISSIELIRILPPEAQLTKMNLTMRVVKGLDNFSEEDRTKFLSDMEQEKVLITSQIEAQIMTNQFNSVQAQAGIQDLMAPPTQAQQDAPTQGAPQEMEGPVRQGGGGPEQLAVRTADQVTG